MSDRGGKDQWVARVLGIKVATMSVAAAEAARVAPDLRFRTLMLQWREAQSKLSAGLESLARNLLGRSDVREDPRFDAVKRAAARLPALVPTFGGELEDILDAGINEGRGPKAAALAAQAVAAIDAYRQKIAGAARLAALETFAADDLGTAVPLGGEMDATLAAMRAQLSRPV